MSSTRNKEIRKILTETDKGLWFKQSLLLVLDQQPCSFAALFSRGLSVEKKYLKSKFLFSRVELKVYCR